MLIRTSSTHNCFRFLSTHLAHIAVAWWDLCNALYVTNMSNLVQCGWGWLPPSKTSSLSLHVTVHKVDSQCAPGFVPPWSSPHQAIYAARFPREGEPVGPSTFYGGGGPSGCPGPHRPGPTYGSPRTLPPITNCTRGNGPSGGAFPGRCVPPPSQSSSRRMGRSTRRLGTPTQPAPSRRLGRSPAGYAG